MALKKCPKCESEEVRITTLATHKSDECYGIEIKDDHYIAYNSDSSWSTIDETEKFECDTCGHEWDLDSRVVWEWNE